MLRVAINGFGRIGRNAFRVNLEKNLVEIVALNDPGDMASLAHLLEYDSIYGRCEAEIEVVSNQVMRVNGKEIRVFNTRDPKDLPWDELGVDVVLECTGVFTDREGAAQHLVAGAKKVLVSAPGKGMDKTIVLGVNDDQLSADDKIISNASCTTNCLAPIAKVLHQSFGIKKGLMTTIHAYTNDQKILDLPHRDLRRARAAGLSIIPTSTGAATAVGEVLPDLKGKLNGLAMRVPVETVSTVDLVAELAREVSVDEVNQALRQAAEGDLQGILTVSDKPLVSRDFRKNEFSAIVDSQLTMMIGGNMVKVVAWYDNEWGYSVRLVELAAKLAGFM